MFAIRVKTVDIAPEDRKEAAMNEFRARFLAAYDTAPAQSLWRDAAKEVRLVLETRLGLAAKKWREVHPARRSRCPSRTA